MAVTVQRRLERGGRFAEQIAEAGFRKVIPQLEDIGADAVRRADILVGNLYGSGGDRSKPGTVRLQGSFYYEVEKAPKGRSFVGVVRLKSRAAAGKVGALNFGTEGGYKIRPRNPAGALTLPNQGLSASDRRHPDKPARRKEVIAGAITGTHFMERSLEAAFRSKFQRGVRARVGR